MLRLAALIVLITVAGCRSKERQPGADSVADDAAPAAVAAMGDGPSPVSPVRVALDSPLRPDAMLAVPGTSRAAVSGEIDGKAALQLVDIDAAKVVWTDTRWCVGRLVHATAETVLCAGGKGVQAIRVADGQPAWSSPRKFRAAVDGRVLAGTALLDANTGKPGRVVADEPPYLKYIQRLCPDGAIYAWLPSGVVMRLSPDFGIEWNADLGAAPTRVDACGAAALFEVPAADEERHLYALDPKTGATVRGPIDVLGWWSAIDGDGVVVATVSGIHRRTRDLAEPVAIAPERVAGRALAEGPGTRLVRAVSGTLLLLDGEGIRAWMAAPTAPRAAVVTKTRVLTAGWAVQRSAAERLQLYELPTARMAWPSTPLARRDPVTLAAAEVIALPEQTELGAATVIADEAHGKLGVSAIAVGDGAVYAAVLERRPSKKTGAAVAAFDLRERAWAWHQPAGCAENASVVQLAVAGGAVVCATRAAAGTGELVGISADTGAPRWRISLPAIDRVAGAGDHLVAVAGERAVVLDPATGAVRREIVSDNGHAPRVVVVREGVVSAEQGALVGPGWRVDVNGHVAVLAASENAVLVSLADGALYAVDPKTGAPREVAGWSAGPDVIVAGDRAFDVPRSPEGTYVLRGYGADGAEALRITLPRAAHLVPNRLGAGAPIVVVDDHRAAYAVEFDPATGAATATHPWPANALRTGAFSAVVDGVPIAGVVLRRPLSVHLFPR